MAAEFGRVDVVRLLTEAKAHINIQTEVHAVCDVYLFISTLCHMTDERACMGNVVCMYFLYQLTSRTCDQSSGATMQCPWIVTRPPSLHVDMLVLGECSILVL